MSKVKAATPLRSFDSMLDQLMSACHKLQLTSDNFGDYTTLPEEHIRAAWVVNEVARDLDQIRKELWEAGSFGAWLESSQHRRE